MNVSPSTFDPQQNNDRYSVVMQQRSNRVSPSNTQNAVSTSLNDIVIEPPEGSGISDVSTDSVEIFDVVPKSEIDREAEQLQELFPTVSPNAIHQLLQEHSKQSDRYRIVLEILLVKTENVTGTTRMTVEAPVPKELLDFFANHACASTEGSAQTFLKEVAQLLKNKLRVSQAVASPHIRRAIADVLLSSEPGADEPSTKKRPRRRDIEEIRDQVVDRATQLIVGAVGKDQSTSALGMQQSDGRSNADKGSLRIDDGYGPDLLRSRENRPRLQQMSEGSDEQRIFRRLGMKGMMRWKYPLGDKRGPSPIYCDFEKPTENFNENPKNPWANGEPSAAADPTNPEASTAAAPTNPTSDWNLFGGFQASDLSQSADFANSSGAVGGANFGYGGFGMSYVDEFYAPSYQLVPGSYDPSQSIRHAPGPYDPVEPIKQAKFGGGSPVFAEFADPAPNPPSVAFEQIIPSTVLQPTEPLYSPTAVQTQPAEPMYRLPTDPQPAVALEQIIPPADPQLANSLCRLSADPRPAKPQYSPAAIPQPVHPPLSPISPVDQSPPVVDSERVRTAVSALCQRFPAANAETLRAMLSEVTEVEFPKVFAAARDSLRAVDPNSKLARGKAKSVRFVEGNFGGPDLAANENSGPNSNSAEVHIAERIYEMFPQADPQFILAELGRGCSAENLIDRMMRGAYPKEKDRLAKERNRRRREDLMEPVLFEVDEFLLTFDDPEEFFANRQRVVSQLYIEHAVVGLMNRFRDYREQFIRQQLEDNSNLFLLTFRALTNMKNKEKNHRPERHVQQPRTNDLEYPEEIEEIYFREWQYVQNEIRIRNAIRERAADRARKLAIARNRGELLLECEICFRDDCLPDEIAHCEANPAHRCCRECAKKHAMQRIGQGNHYVACVADGCDAAIPLATLREFLSPQAISLLLRRATQEQLRAAGLANLHGCPFCDFSMVIENPNEKVFRCLNADCLRESCLFCKEPNHVPLKCDEVEKGDETAMRTYIENKMAEAMIRKCPGCGTSVIRNSGCNHMTCSCCKTHFCYVCRKVMDMQSRQGWHQCTQEADANLHAREARDAGEQARKKFLEQHPEFEDRPQPNIENLVDRATPPPNFDANRHRRDFFNPFFDLGGREFFPALRLERLEPLRAMDEFRISRRRRRIRTNSPEREDRLRRIDSSIDSVVRGTQAQSGADAVAGGLETEMRGTHAQIGAAAAAQGLGTQAQSGVVAAADGLGTEDERRREIEEIERYLFADSPQELGSMQPAAALVARSSSPATYLTPEPPINLLPMAAGRSFKELLKDVDPPDVAERLTDAEKDARSARRRRRVGNDQIAHRQPDEAQAKKPKTTAAAAAQMHSTELQNRSLGPQPIAQGPKLQLKTDPEDSYRSVIASISRSTSATRVEAHEDPSVMPALQSGSPLAAVGAADPMDATNAMEITGGNRADFSSNANKLQEIGTAANRMMKNFGQPLDEELRQLEERTATGPSSTRRKRTVAICEVDPDPLIEDWPTGGAKRAPDQLPNTAEDLEAELRRIRERLQENCTERRQLQCRLNVVNRDIENDESFELQLQQRLVDLRANQPSAPQQKNSGEVSKGKFAGGIRAENLQRSDAESKSQQTNHIKMDGMQHKLSTIVHKAAPMSQNQAAVSGPQPSQAWDQATACGPQPSQAWNQATPNGPQSSQAWDQAAVTGPQPSQAWHPPAVNWPQPSQAWDQATARGSQPFEIWTPASPPSQLWTPGMASGPQPFQAWKPAPASFTAARPSWAAPLCQTSPAALISNYPMYGTGSEWQRIHDQLVHVMMLHANMQREMAAVQQDQQMPAEEKRPQLGRLREELDRAAQKIRELETLMAEK